MLEVALNISKDDRNNTNISKEDKDNMYTAIVNTMYNTIPIF